MQPEDISKKWYTLVLESKIDSHDPFFKFIGIWIAFNALYCSFSTEVYDWEQIKDFSGEPKAIDTHRKLLQIDPEYKEAINTVKDKGVFDIRSQRQRNIRNINNLTEVLSCLYQIRCNLFHGGKQFDSSRDRELVGAGFTIISRLIRPYLEN